MNILGLTECFPGVTNQEAGSGTDLGGNHRLMHMKEWEEEEWWASEHRMLLLLMRFELCGRGGVTVHKGVPF
ncbi:hypothetical protein BHM03_00016329 [Ensete ventricosum]|nr:hypothetical protein BHM03_00016329 [Ensete ventricosum]